MHTLIHTIRMFLLNITIKSPNDRKSFRCQKLPDGEYKFQSQMDTSTTEESMLKLMQRPHN